MYVAPCIGHLRGMVEATEEIQELLNFLLPQAERMLGEHGEFYPYAATV